MPDLDASSAIGQDSTRLLDKVRQNKDLCNNFISILWCLANTATARGARMDRMRIGEITMTENRIRFKVEFRPLILGTSRYISVQASGIAQHIGAENIELSIMIRSNPDIPIMLEGIVEKMDAYGRDKGKRFEEIQFIKGYFVETEDCFILEIDKSC
jgi:hypothetical protein